MADPGDLWKMTAVGVLVAAATAVVTGLVVTNRAGVDQEVEVRATPAASRATAPGRVASTPPRSVTEACNRQAAAQLGDRRDRKGKIIEAGKDAGIGALGAAVGALGGAGGGTLYGIRDNEKHDERFRTAYASCMKSRGYSA
jgi:hypothetical protein